MSTQQRIDISYISILRVLVILAGLVFIYFIRDILALVFVSVFLTAALTPWVNWFQKHSIPRGLAVLIIYLIAFAVIALTVYLIIPPLTEQLGMLANTFPDYFHQVLGGFAELQTSSQLSGEGALQESLTSLQSTLASATEGLFSAVSTVFGGIIFFMAVLVLTFYMMINEQAFLKFVNQFTPAAYKDYVIDFIKRVQVRLGHWLRGQLFLMFFIFLLTFIGLLIFKVKFALVLALIAGIMELIPYGGPIIGAIPAIIIALGQSPIKAALVVVLYIIIQQIENNLLVPKVMQKAVGLNPIITILAILTGAKLGGITGAILAVPVVTVISMLVVDWQSHRKSKAKLST